MKQVTLGFVPTRRNIFSAPAAVEYADLTRKRLEQLGVRFVDVTGINPEGLFYDEADRAAASVRPTWTVCSSPTAISAQSTSAPGLPGS